MISIRRCIKCKKEFEAEVNTDKMICYFCENGISDSIRRHMEESGIDLIEPTVEKASENIEEIPDNFLDYIADVCVAAPKESRKGSHRTNKIGKEIKKNGTGLLL